MRPAAVYICKRKCLENGEWSEGLSYCVGEEVSAGTRGEDVGILHPIDKKAVGLINLRFGDCYGMIRSTVKK